MKYALCVSGWHIKHDDLRALQLVAFGLCQPLSSRDWSIHELVDGAIDWEHELMSYLAGEPVPPKLYDAVLSF